MCKITTKKFKKSVDKSPGLCYTIVTKGEGNPVSAEAGATEGPEGDHPKLNKEDLMDWSDFSYEQAMSEIEWATESEIEDWPEDLWED